MPDINAAIAEFGPWTAHSIEYETGMFTFGDERSASWIASRADCYAFLFELFTRKPIDRCRILDVGCFEGGLSFHLAKHGASVVGLEIRDSHLGRCDFIKQSFPNLELSFVKGDMLRLRDKDLGKFDGILMAGTLYHINAPDIRGVLADLRSICTGAVVIDTHVANKALEVYVDEEGRKTHGRSIIEHNENDTVEDREQRLRTAYENNFSFWPTERSLVNNVVWAGFDWCVKPITPTVQWPFGDRDLWVAGTGGTSIAIEPPVLEEPDSRPTDHRMFHNRNHVQKHNPDTRRL